ncbi:MAG: iron chelate uptake ABC transporter family permease subunit [Pseudomonadota bacterium]|nr:iron chelate uptake ABC transporter family permease subunit [Pseudomonadota bacterium]
MTIEPFIIKGLIAGVIVALVAGVMGCFVVWRRMAYFGDSLAHSALLGIALGIALGVNHNISVIMLCSLFALILVWLQQKRIFATDTLLGILAHASLSIGVITISILEQIIDLHSYLFGDILTVGNDQIWWLVIGGGSVLGVLTYNWSSLVLMTIDEDLAQAENVPVARYQMLLMFLMTIVVAISIKIVGILLIASLLIIAPAASRQLSKSPEMMAMIACLIGVISVVIGMYFSFELDTPSGPTIVAALAALFVISFPISRITTKKNENFPLAKRGD